MSRRDTSLKLEDVMRTITLTPSEDAFLRELKDFERELIRQEYIDMLRTKLQVMKAELESKLRQMQPASQPALPPIDPEILKKLDHESLMKLRLLMAPASSQDAAALLLAYLLTQQPRQSDGTSTTAELLKAIAQQNAEMMKTLVQMLTQMQQTQRADVVSKLTETLLKYALEENPRLIELRKEIEELKKDVKSQDPIAFIDTVNKLAERLGLTKSNNIEIEKMRLDLEKWKAEQEMKFKRIKLAHKLKMSGEMRKERVRAYLIKYLLAPVLRPIMSKATERMLTSSSVPLEQIERAPSAEVACPKCNQKFIVKADVSGRFPDVVTCPFCGMRFIRSDLAVSTHGGQTGAEARAEQNQ